MRGRTLAAIYSAILDVAAVRVPEAEQIDHRSRPAGLVSGHVTELECER